MMLIFLLSLGAVVSQTISKESDRTSSVFPSSPKGKSTLKPESNSLLLNGNFSKFEGKLPKNWELMDSTTDCEKVPNGVRVTVSKEGTFDSSLGQNIRTLDGSGNYLLTGYVEARTSRIAYLQIKLYKNRKEIRRLTSAHAPAGKTFLQLAFQTDQADLVQVICRLAEKGNQGNSAVFSDLKLRAIKEGESIAWTSCQGNADLEYGADSFSALLHGSEKGQYIFHQIITRKSQEKGDWEFAVKTTSDFIAMAHLEVDLYQGAQKIGSASSLQNAADEKHEIQKSVRNGQAAPAGGSNRFPTDRLRLKFDPKGADRFALRICFDGAEIYHGERVTCSEFYFGSFRKDLKDFQREKIRLETVPGYQVCGIYLHNCQSERESDFRSKLQYRKEGESKWRDALDLVYIPAERCARGSLLALEENCSWSFRLEFDDRGMKKIVQKSFRTLSADVPIMKKIELTSANFRKIADLIPPDFFLKNEAEGDFENGQTSPGFSGNAANGYLRITSQPGVVLNAANDFPAAVFLDGVHHIILDGLTIRGGAIDGIRLYRSKNVQIVNCDISGFGKTGRRRVDLDGKFYLEGTDRRALNNNAGIHVLDCDQILIERNYIHDPRGTANSWFYSHPAGPNAVFIGGTSGAAIRYNDFIGSTLKRWNDTIEGESGNGSNNGSVYRDAEICGNYFAFGNDDGMELDGGQINCRFFGNRTEGHLCGVSTAPCRKGPSYLYQNVFCNPGDEYDLFGIGIKNVYGNLGLGRLYFFNNTTIGYGTGFSGPGGTKEEYEAVRGLNLLKAVARNNLSLTESMISSSLYENLKSDFDYDLFYHNSRDLQKEFDKLKKAGQENHGLILKPEFYDEEAGRYELKQGSAGFEDGIPVADLLPQKKVSRGAFQKDGPVSIPVRPVPFYTDRMTVVLNANDDQGLTDSQKITILQQAGKELSGSFEIYQPEGASFFKVTPNRGRFESNKPVTLTVTSVPEKIKQARRNTSAFCIRTENGFSRPVSVMVDSRENKTLIAEMRKDVIYGSSAANDLSLTSDDSANLSGADSTKKSSSVTSAPSKSKSQVKSESQSKSAAVVFDIPKDGQYWLFVKASGKIRKLTLDEGETISRMKLGSSLSKDPWFNIAPNVFHGEPNRPFKLTKGRHVFVLSTGTGERCFVQKAALTEDPDAFRLCP